MYSNTFTQSIFIYTYKRTSKFTHAYVETYTPEYVLLE